LRVDDRGLVRGVAEEGRIEQLDPVEDGARLDVARVAEQARIDAGDPSVLVAEERDRLDAVAEIAPECVEGRRTRKATAHPDDRDAGQGIGQFRLTHRSSSCSWRAASGGRSPLFAARCGLPYPATRRARAARGSGSSPGR